MCEFNIYLPLHLLSGDSLFVGLLFVIFLTFVVRVILSPTLSMLFVFVTYSSIWLPQIIRSVRRGRGSGLSKGYLFGTTICRLFNCLCEYPLPSRFGYTDTFFRFPGMPQKCSGSGTPPYINISFFYHWHVVTSLFSLGMGSRCICNYPGMFGDITRHSRDYLLPTGTSSFFQLNLGCDVEFFVLLVCPCESLRLPPTNAASRRWVTGEVPWWLCHLHGCHPGRPVDVPLKVFRYKGRLGWNGSFIGPSVRNDRW